MKVKLKELKPNPFKRYINGGVLNPQKIELLKESINKDGFWAGIMFREVGGEKQIPYGHHRLESAKQVKGGNFEIDIPCQDFTDEQMVRMLANENSMQNEEYAIYQVDTVVMTQNYLKEFRPQRERKSNGRPPEIGSIEHISEFLGEKNWQKTKVAQYLRMKASLAPKLMKDLKNSANVGNDNRNFTVSHARSLVRLEPELQEEVYNEIKNKDITHREMHDIVAEIESGSSVEDAVEKVEQNRNSKETIRKTLAPFEGQKIVLMCDSLIKSIKNNPISTYPPKGQAILRKMYGQLLELLTKEMED